MGKGGGIARDAATKSIGRFAVPSPIYVEIFHDDRKFWWACGGLRLRSRWNPSTLVRSHRLLIWPVPGVCTSLSIHANLISSIGLLRVPPPSFTTIIICAICERCSLTSTRISVWPPPLRRGVICALWKAPHSTGCTMTTVMTHRLGTITSDLATSTMGDMKREE